MNNFYPFTNQTRQLIRNLKPCKHCGGKPDFVQKRFPYMNFLCNENKQSVFYWVRCTKCKYETQRYATKEEAANEWNEEN